MTVIAIIIATVLDRFAQQMPGRQILTRLGNAGWLNGYLSKIVGWLEKAGLKNNYLIVLSAFLPLAILLLVIKLLFGLAFGKMGAPLFVLLTLFYFLGNRDVEQQDIPFVAVHETSFGILFWFALLGPTGGLLYWFLVNSKHTMVANEPSNGGLRAALVWLHAMVAWLSARVTGFLYALVGNFTSGFRCWLNCVRALNMQSSQVLQDCGNSAVDHSIAGDDVQLVARTYVAWVVLAVLIVIFK